MPGREVSRASTPSPARVIALALVAVVLGLLGSVTSQSAPMTTLRIGLVTHGITYVPLYFGAQRFFAEEGLVVDMVILPSGSQLMTAVATGAVDVVSLSLDAALPVIEAGHAIRVFYAPRTASGYTWWARPGVAGWTDLRGRAVGVSGPGTLTEGLTRFVLQRRGLEPGVDVTLVQLGDSRTRLAALRAGRVDAVILSPPFSYVAQEQGLRLLGRQEMDIGELWPQAAFAARERVLAEKPAALQAFLRAYVRGVRRTRADREASVELLMAWAKQSRADAERVYAEVLPTFDERGVPSPRAMAVFWQVMAAIGQAPTPWPEARFLDRRFVDTFDDWAPPR